MKRSQFSHVGAKKGSNLTGRSLRLMFRPAVPCVKCRVEPTTVWARFVRGGGHSPQAP